MSAAVVRWWVKLSDFPDGKVISAYPVNGQGEAFVPNDTEFVRASDFDRVKESPSTHASCDDVIVKLSIRIGRLTTELKDAKESLSVANLAGWSLREENDRLKADNQRLSRDFSQTIAEISQLRPKAQAMIDSYQPHVAEQRCRGCDLAWQNLRQALKAPTAAVISECTCLRPFDTQPGPHHSLACPRHMS